MLSYALYLTKIGQATQKLLVLQFVRQNENTFVQQSINMFFVSSISMSETVGDTLGNPMLDIIILKNRYSLLAGHREK